MTNISSSNLTEMLCSQNLESLNSSAQLLSNFKFYGQGVTVVVLSTFGVIGNTLAILTISSMNRCVIDMLSHLTVKFKIEVSGLLLLLLLLLL
jgi:hypothetical protein